MAMQEKTYLVLFQIAERANRDNMREGLRSFESYCPLTNTAWAIVSEKSAAELRNQLGKFVVKPDRLYILELGHSGAWRNAISEKHSEWLKANL
jgi:hypothetical protein